jgi:hypothetical protein
MLLGVCYACLHYIEEELGALRLSDLLKIVQPMGDPGYK